MTRGTATATTAVCLAVSVALAAPADPPLAWRTYDVADLVTPAPDHPGPVLRLAPGGGRDPGWGDRTGALLDTKNLEGLLRDAAPDVWRAPGAQCTVRGTSCEVWAPADAQAEVGRLLAWVRWALARPVTVNVRLARIDPAGSRALMAALGPDGTAPPETIDAALAVAGAEVVHECVLAGRLGSRVHAAALRHRAYLADHDAEVAAQATVADPVVRNLETGAVCEIRIDGRPDGRLDLTIRAAWAPASEPARVRDTAAGRVELPARTVVSLHAAPCIEPGRAWVGTVAGQAGGLAVVCVPRSPSAPPRPPEPAPGIRVHRVYPVGQLLRSLPGTPDEQLRLPIDAVAAGSWVPAEPGIPASETEALVRSVQALEPGAWRDDAAVWLSGRVLWVRQDGPMHARVAAHLETLAAARPAAIRIEALLVAGTTDLDATLAAGGAGDRLDRWLARPGTLLRAHLAANGPPGGAVSGLAGRIEAVIDDYEVEVSQGLEVPDPIVGIVSEGVEVGVRLPARGADPLAPEVAVRWMTVARPMRMADSPHGPVDVPDVSHGGAHAHPSLPPGAWSALRLGPDATGRPLVLLVRAAPVR